jgi:hypothetical protein
MIVRFLMALQSAGALAASPLIMPLDFDLRSAPRMKDGDIVVTARRRNQRIDPLLKEDGVPPIGRAETRLFGKVRAGVDVTSREIAPGLTSVPVMVTFKIPF